MVFRKRSGGSAGAFALPPEPRTRRGFARQDFRLVAAEGFDGAELGGAAGGVEAEDDADERGDAEREQGGPPGDDGLHLPDRRDDKGQDDTHDVLVSSDINLFA